MKGISALGTQGHFIQEGFLGALLAQRLRTLADQELAEGALTVPGTSRGRTGNSGQPVRGDLTRWMAESDALYPELYEKFNALRLGLNVEAYLGLRRFDLQLAHYREGATGYARHRDAFRTPGPVRRVTAIVYLNPDWEPRHGGMLRLYAPGGAIDVGPVMDRAVIFLSELLEHEVLAPNAPRWALTAWYYA